MKTREQILADITIIYKKYFPTFNTNRTVFADLYLNAPTEVLEQIYASLTYLLNIFNLTKVNDIQTVDLDNYAASYGLTRLPGTKANGRIRFYKTILPSSPILIPASTAVATRSCSKPSRSRRAARSATWTESSPGWPTRSCAHRRRSTSLTMSRWSAGS